MTYTIKRIQAKNFTEVERQFIITSALKLELMYGEQRYKWDDFPIIDFIENHYMIMCYRDERPVGFLMATFSKSFFDKRTILLRQNLLFSLPKTRASLLLLKEFIDFGKVNANHIITAVGPKTNIKRQSLEKLGFNKLEEVYRIEGKQ